MIALDIVHGGYGWGRSYVTDYFFRNSHEITNLSKALPGVSDATLARLFTMPRRMQVDGRHMVAMLVEDYSVSQQPCDVVTWPIDAPDELWSVFRVRAKLGRVSGLGVPDIPVFTSALEWLQRDMKGVVYLG